MACRRSKTPTTLIEFCLDLGDTPVIPCPTAHRSPANPDQTLIPSPTCANPKRGGGPEASFDPSRFTTPGCPRHQGTSILHHVAAHAHVHGGAVEEVKRTNKLLPTNTCLSLSPNPAGYLSDLRPLSRLLFSRLFQHIRSHQDADDRDWPLFKSAFIPVMTFTLRAVFPSA